MGNQKGFTLVELLVAATIIGILAVFATVSYRDGVAETRFTEAKTMTEQLAAAAQRAKVDYPALRFSSAAMSNGGGSCPFYPGITSASASDLIGCGYLEKSGWTNEYFTFYLCDQNTVCQNKGINSENPVACVYVKSSAKLPAKYKSYTYCYYAGQGGRETH